MSRHRFHVATSHTAPMSRHQIHVATSIPNRPGRDLLETNLCRDIIFMSRPHSSPQWDFQVATPKSMSRPPILPLMSRTQNDVATSTSTQPHLCYVATPCRDLPCCHPCRDLKMMSRHQFQLAKLRPTATQPGRDATSWSRPHAQPSQVATS